MTEDARRKHARYNVHWACRLLLSNKTIVTANVKNISLGGIGFEILQMIPVGQKVNFETRPMVGGKPYLFRAKGEVTFSMIMGGGSGFSQGMRFTLVPDEHEKALANIVKVLELSK